ncbi:hypothetical protein L7F22_016339 [Adiantum nelumboides]|nr:hypothetical protein [Adiantum nelumboides]
MNLMQLAGDGECYSRQHRAVPISKLKGLQNRKLRVCPYWGSCPLPAAKGPGEFVRNNSSSSDAQCANAAMLSSSQGGSTAKVAA